MSTMTLKVLVDNNTFIDQYYWGEPAVCYYLELDGLKILFDTGYSDIFLKNAQKMGIDLSALTHVVLSHGHNDHSNGLQYLCKNFATRRMKLIAHPHCFLPKRYGEDDIGAPMSLAEIENSFDFQPRTQPCKISEHCIFLGEIPELFAHEKRRALGERFSGGAWEKDFLPDDTAIACQTKQGLAIVTGCSHSGICNIVEYARRVCDERRIVDVIGGMHLFKADERLQQTIAYLAELGLPGMHPCHCVSLRAKCTMARVLPIHEAGVGLTLKFEL